MTILSPKIRGNRCLQMPTRKCGILLENNGKQIFQGRYYEIAECQACNCIQFKRKFCITTIIIYRYKSLCIIVSVFLRTRSLDTRGWRIYAPVTYRLGKK